MVCRVDDVDEGPGPALGAGGRCEVPSEPRQAVADSGRNRAGRRNGTRAARAVRWMIMAEAAGSAQERRAGGAVEKAQRAGLAR